MNNYYMGIKSLLHFINYLFRDIEVMLGTLSASYKCSQMVFKTLMHLSTQVSFGAGFSERQLHMLSEGKHSLASTECASCKCIFLPAPLEAIIKSCV